VRDAGRDVCVLKSAGNVHAWWTLRNEDSPPSFRERGAEKSEPRMFADEPKEDTVIHRKGARRQGRKGYRNLRGYFLLATLDEDLRVLVTF
jgi:hypothetical protein